MNTIGERIAYLRKNNGMTQDALATALGVSPQTVSKWETGTTMPDILLLPVIAEVFGTDIDSLFGGRGYSRSVSKQNIYSIVYNDFFMALQELWNAADGESKLSHEEAAKEAQKYLKEHRYAQTMVLSNEEGNGVYANADIALIFNKAKDETPKLLDSDAAWTVLKRFADGETRAVFKFFTEHRQRSFTSSLIASKCNIDIKLAERALENLLQMNLIGRQDVDTGDGILYVYSSWGAHKLILIYTMLAIAERLGEYKESYRGFMS